MKDTERISKEQLARREERLRRIGLKEIPRELPGLKLDGKEARISRRTHRDHYYEVEVTDLAHLKQLVGNPDRSLETNGKREYVPFPMHGYELPDGRFEDMSSLSRTEQLAIERAAKNVVFGHSKAIDLDTSQLGALQDWIMRLGHHIPVFTAPDLDVADGTTATLSGAAVYYFHVVTVHGSGSIRVENSAKIVVDDMRCVP